MELRKGLRSEGDFRELQFFNSITGEDMRTIYESEYACGEECQSRVRAERSQGEAECEIAKLRAMLELAAILGAKDASSDGT